jgi:hypothetical protein
MPFFIILLSFLLIGCSSKKEVIPYLETYVKKSSSNGYTGNKTTPFFFQKENNFYAGYLWYNEGEIQPKGKLIMVIDENKNQSLVKKDVYPCNGRFIKGEYNDDGFLIKDVLCYDND